MTEEGPKPRGGARKGAGRKAVDGARGLRRRNVNLDDATIERARKLGGGDVSAGLRKGMLVAVSVDVEAVLAESARDEAASKPFKPRPTKAEQRKVLDLMMSDHNRKNDHP